MEQKQPNIYNKITKVSLVIYCFVALVCFIAFLTSSFLLKNWSFLYGFLLCLGPGIIFVLVSCLLPTARLVDSKSGKGIIAWYIVAYILKYALIIGIPFIGLVNIGLFNRWAMLTTTLLAPIVIIISKIIFANIVSKKSKK